MSMKQLIKNLFYEDLKIWLADCLLTLESLQESVSNSGFSFLIS